MTEHYDLICDLIINWPTGEDGLPIGPVPGSVDRRIQMHIVNTIMEDDLDRPRNTPWRDVLVNNNRPTIVADEDKSLYSKKRKIPQTFLKLNRTAPRMTTPLAVPGEPPRTEGLLTDEKTRKELGISEDAAQEEERRS